MFTRGHLAPQYSTPAPTHINLPGYLKVEERKGVPQMWPVARPCYGWTADGAPYYLGTPRVNRAPQNRLIRKAGFAFAPSQPAWEMDPSDHTTWQRQYRWT